MSEAADIPPPAANSALYGHDHAEALLSRLIDRGRLPHGWLITGPEGAGKATLACRLARYLLAHGDRDSAPSGLFGEENHDSLAIDPDNPVAQRVAAGSHADLLVIERGLDPKTGKRRNEIMINDIRKAQHFLSVTSAEGGWRIVIIDTVDDLNRNAANALLKILEEPPEQSLLLLLSNRPGRLLPTIRSRCRKLVLKPLEFDAFAACLHHLGVEADHINAGLYDRAHGLPGRALALLHSADDVLDSALAVIFADGEPGRRAQAIIDMAGRFSGPARADAADALLEAIRDRIASDIRRGRPGHAGGFDAVPLDRRLELCDKAARRVTASRGLYLDRRAVLISLCFDIERAKRSSKQEAGSPA